MRERAVAVPWGTLLRRLGALPIRFGMPRARVVELLGQPEASHPAWDGNGTTDYWNESRIMPR
jgi:hypothetical protein